MLFVGVLVGHVRRIIVSLFSLVGCLRLPPTHPLPLPRCVVFDKDWFVFVCLLICSLSSIACSLCLLLFFAICSTVARTFVHGEAFLESKRARWEAGWGFFEHACVSGWCLEGTCTPTRPFPLFWICTCLESFSCVFLFWAWVDCV